MVIGCLLAVPLTLLAFSQNSAVALDLAGLASFVGALWGAMRLASAFGIHAGLGAAAAILAAVIAFSGASGASGAANALAVCAGLGAAHLLYIAFSRKALLIFMVAFAAMDVLIVSSGLVTSAIHQLPLVGVFNGSGGRAHVLVFNRVQVKGALLGSGDIAYAALVAAIIGGTNLKRVSAYLSCCLYALAAIALAAFATSDNTAVPATAPGVIALATASALWLVQRRSNEVMPALPSPSSLTAAVRNLS
jgi:hypothetical protein